jgi:putative flippase GtrA
MKARWHTLRQHEAVRFLLSGGTNTAVSWLLYLLLITISVPYTLAYSVAFAFGIVFTYYLNTRWVFKVAMSWRSFLQFPLVYLAQYGLGMLLLILLVDMWHLPKAYGPPVVTLIALPLTFVLSRFVLKRPAASK